MTHRAGPSHTLRLVSRSRWTGLSATITLDIVSHSRASVRKLEPSNSVSEELDLATLANACHNVEAVCRQCKRITDWVYDTVYLFFYASDNLTTNNITLSF